ncbi:serine/threonine protein kinase [Sporothrix eucalyptigena]|uniref:non-specific serine/threonine protein kinase n=1 Tax=Sporothrix eucalyptigena TaxID=1812306 RepID=A0ABP0AWN3_9PEZI
MNGDLSLSKALGGLRIANPDDSESPSASADSEPREAFPQLQTSPDPNATYSSQSASHSTSSLSVHQQVPPRGSSPYDASALFKSAQASLGNVQALDPSARAPPDQYLNTQHSVYRPGAGSVGPSSSSRPMSTVYTSPVSGTTTDPTSNSPTGYGAARGNEPARASSYRQPSRSDSRSQHPPTSYVSSISPESNHIDRTYNGPRQNMALPPGGSTSPLPPRRSSKGMAGGYVSIPAGSASSSQTQAGSHGPEAAVSKSSEDWKERGAAVSVRKEVDASGKPVYRTVKKGVQDFSFGRILGEGSYSSVYLATDRQSLKEYAIKVLEKKHIIKEKKVKYVNIEKNTLNRLTDHPGIVRLYYTFQDEQSLYYVLDLCSGGELLGILKRTGTFDVECTRFYGAQILDAIRYMHSRGVIHRDLKPENVLLDENMHVKITDFGTAKLLPDPRDQIADAGMGGSLSSQGDGRSASFVGTAEYVSPELLMDKSASKASDLWAFGCIIYQLLAGRPPFKGGSEYLTFQKIVNLEYEFPPGFPPAARDLVERCLVLEPARRLTIEHIMNHEFFDGQPFGRDLWRTKAPRLRPYVPPTQDAHIIQLNGSAPPPQPISTSRGGPMGQSSPGGNNGALGSQMSPGSSQRPPRIITELPPPTQLDLDWSPVLTRQNERILKLGDLMVVSTPIPNSPHGKSDSDGHKKLSRFFGGNTTKKRQRLVMVTSSGRIVFAPAGGDEKKAKQEISLLNSDCVWRTQTDAKGQPVWCVDTGGTHYVFEEPKQGGIEGGMAAVESWIESLERAKDLALSQNILASYRSEEFGDMSSSMSSPASTLGGRMGHSGKSQSNGDDTIISERKRNRFSKRQSKNGLGAQF